MTTFSSPPTSHLFLGVLLLTVDAGACFQGAVSSRHLAGVKASLQLKAIYVLRVKALHVDMSDG